MTTSNVGQEPTEDRKSRRELLLKVYSTAIDEYRFNVQLSWDRTKFFLLLSSGLIAGGVGLIRVAQDSTETSVFLIIFFVLSILINMLGLNTVAVGKNYYREAVFTKTIMERELGLLKAIHDLPDPRANFSISVTDGQRDFVNVLFGIPAQPRRQFPPQSITEYSEVIFWTMILINCLGAMIATYNYAHRAFD
jgi:hypothetical protein